MTTTGLILFFVGLVIQVLTWIGYAKTTSRVVPLKRPIGPGGWDDEFDKKRDAMNKMMIPGVIGGALILGGLVLVVVGLVQGASPALL